MEKQNKESGKWIFIIAVIVVLVILSFIIAGIIGIFFTIGSSDTTLSIGDGNVALIPIKGVILSEDAGLFLREDVASSTEIVNNIEDAGENPEIIAILLEIDSPGGAPVASEEIANAIMDSEKYTVAWIRETGASGAYWAASAADKIIANKMSLIGSVGVMGSYLEFSGLMSKYGVGYERFVGGEYKDMGAPYRKSTIDERKVFQRKIDQLQGFFLDSVAENRKLNKEQRDAISTGEFFIGAEGLELGLVDVLGGKKQAIELIESELNITAEIVEYKKRKSFLDIFAELTGRQSFYFGEGFANMLLEKEKASGFELRT